jgi:hypothetical protein
VPAALRIQFHASKLPQVDACYWRESDFDICYKRGRAIGRVGASRHPRLHVMDYNLALGDLVDVVGQQAAAWPRGA